MENLHVYRMLREVRNIDTGPMKFYHVVGWGIPAIVTGKNTQGSSARVACVKIQISPKPSVLVFSWPLAVPLAVYRRVATPSPRGDGSLWSGVSRWVRVFGVLCAVLNWKKFCSSHRMRGVSVSG